MEIKEKLICVLNNNIKDLEFFSSRIWLRVDNYYIQIYKNQKYNTETIEVRKGNFFFKPKYIEKTNLLGEYYYILTYQEFEFNVEESLYLSLLEKTKEYKLKSIIDKLDKLCNK